ncbi:MAG: hypothetical protein FWF80_00390, partial [Defluviitaleaceae bacterium]|nr:hypothetical protein [Defluviitaleaceae bacterium]
MKITPVKNYTPPSLPTLEDERAKQKLLKKLPKRWLSGASGAVACAGFVGLVLAGCACRAGEEFVPLTEDERRARMEIAAEAYINIRADLQTSELNLERRGGFGGAGATPFYVAYFTEQDAFDFIRVQLEAAGLNFDAQPPGGTVRYTYWIPIRDGGFFQRPRRTRVGIDLYDEERNVGIAHVNWPDHNWRRIESQVQEMEQQFGRRADSTVAVFFNPATLYQSVGEPPLGLWAWTQDWREKHGEDA